MNTQANDSSGIDYNTNGLTTVYGEDGANFFQAIAISSGLKMYATCKIIPNRNYTPKNMMLMATKITGKKFKARDYIGASEALRDWAMLLKSGLPKTLDGKSVP
jgi:hypothetical protein